MIRCETCRKPAAYILADFSDGPYEGVCYYSRCPECLVKLVLEDKEVAKRAIELPVRLHIEWAANLKSRGYTEDDDV